MQTLEHCDSFVEIRVTNMCVTFWVIGDARSVEFSIPAFHGERGGKGWKPSMEKDSPWSDPEAKVCTYFPPRCTNDT